MVSRSSYSSAVTGQDSGSSEKSRLECEENWILGRREGKERAEREGLSFVVFVASGDFDMLAIYLGDSRLPGSPVLAPLVPSLRHPENGSRRIRLVGGTRSARLPQRPGSGGQLHLECQKVLMSETCFFFFSFLFTSSSSIESD